MLGKLFLVLGETISKLKRNMLFYSDYSSDSVSANPTNMFLGNYFLCCEGETISK